MKNAEKDLAERTKKFARRIIRLFVALPREPVAQVLGKQALRAGTSVGANYREADRARSKAEFISKIGDCLKEADETLYWLELLSDEQVVTPKPSPCSWKWGARPPRALPAGAFAGWHPRLQSHWTVGPFWRPKKWLARAPATAPGAGALPSHSIDTAKRLVPLIQEADELVSIFVTISKRSRGD